MATRLIGTDYQGHLVSDFYGGYNHLPGPHQRCWVHLLRDLNAAGLDASDLDASDALPPEHR